MKLHAPSQENFTRPIPQVEVALSSTASSESLRLAKADGSRSCASLRAVQAVADGSRRCEWLRSMQTMIGGSARVAQMQTLTGGGSVMQLRRVFRSNSNVDDDVAADGIGPDTDWFAYQVNEGLIYVHIDNIASFMEAYPDAEMASPADLENVAEAGELELQLDQADGEGGLEDADNVVDVSKVLHFTDMRVPGNVIKRQADPDQIAPEGLVNALTPHPLSGVITEVRFMQPQNPADHFEVMCLVAPAEEGDEQVGLKFDFNRNGYRMIYGADPDQNGNRFVVGKTKPAQPILISEAAGIFATTSFDGGKYREGANECGSFARNFYAALMKQAPDDSDAEDRPDASVLNRRGAPNLIDDGEF